MADDERALLGALPGQVAQALQAIGRAASRAGAGNGDGEPGDQPAGEVVGEIPETLRRLFPVAYPRDPAAQGAFEALTGGELLEQRREALELLASTSRSTHLEPEALERWLGALNDLRLVLGTSIGVSEDSEMPRPDDPQIGEWAAYGYLSSLVEEIVGVLSGDLPPPVEGAGDDLPEDPWGEAPGGLRWDGTPRPPYRR